MCSQVCKAAEELHHLSVAVECHPVVLGAVGEASHREDGDEGAFTEVKVQVVHSNNQTAISDT
jgi:hypothetical protein